MPSPISSVTTDRLALARAWLTELFPNQRVTFQSASSDASFRSYYRVQGLTEVGASAILMDAPPPQEDCRPFVRVRDLLCSAGIRVPLLFAQNIPQGFLLLSDFGDTTYWTALGRDPLKINLEYEKQLYAEALQSLVKMQVATRAGELPPYDKKRLSDELDLFPTWYLQKHRQQPWDNTTQKVWEGVREALIERALQQAMVYVHRDYHSRNLMVLNPPLGEPGVLDFQDAVEGPISYDLVSLLRDAYVPREEEWVLDQCILYWERARLEKLPVPPLFDNFYQDFEWMGLQRHLKILGIFCRLYYRDGKGRYLDDLPLVRTYARATAERYSLLRPLLGQGWLD